MVRRIPDFNAEAHKAAGQDTLFDVWRFHAFFTTAEPKILDTVAADKTHRHHAVIEQVHADLKNSALAHLPSGVFTANAAWLVLAVIAFNLTRAARHRRGTRPGTGNHRDGPPQAGHRARTSGDLSPTHHPAPAPSLALGDRLDRPVRPGQRPPARLRGLTTQQPPLRDPSNTVEHPGQRGPGAQHALDRSPFGEPDHAITAMPIGGSRFSRGADVGPPPRFVPAVL